MDNTDTNNDKQCSRIINGTQKIGKNVTVSIFPSEITNLHPTSPFFEIDFDDVSIACIGDVKLRIEKQPPYIPKPVIWLTERCHDAKLSKLKPILSDDIVLKDLLPEVGKTDTIDLCFAVKQSQAVALKISLQQPNWRFVGIFTDECYIRSFGSGEFIASTFRQLSLEKLKHLIENVTQMSASKLIIINREGHRLNSTFEETDIFVAINPKENSVLENYAERYNIKLFKTFKIVFFTVEEVLDARTFQTVKDIKLHIEADYDVPIFKLAVFYKGKELADFQQIFDLFLQDHGLSDGIYMHVELDVKPFNIKVYSRLNGEFEMLKIRARETNSVFEVKQMIQAGTNFPVENIGLYIQPGEPLLNDKTLADYGFHPDLILQCKRIFIVRFHFKKPGGIKEHRKTINDGCTTTLKDHLNRILAEIGLKKKDVVLINADSNVDIEIPDGRQRLIDLKENTLHFRIK